MKKQSIGFVSFLLSIFVMLLLIQFITIKQQNFPLGTNKRFAMNTGRTNTKKEILIKELEEVSRRNNSLIVKTAFDAEKQNSLKVKDIITFGELQNERCNPVINNKKVYWLDSSLTGSLIYSNEMGSRILNGTYSVLVTGDIVNDINAWATKNDVDIYWLEHPKLIQTCYNYLLRNGIGNAVLSTFVLLIILVISWIVSHARARAIRLGAGIGKYRISFEDTLAIMTMVMLGYLVGCIVVYLLVGISNSSEQIKLILKPGLVIMSVLSVFTTGVVFGISYLIRPQIKHLSERKIPFNEIKVLAFVGQILSIILAIIIIPTTMTSGYIYFQLSKEYALWKSYSSYVKLSFSDIDSLENEMMLPKFESFLEKMEDNDNLSISFVIDRAIELSDEIMSGYDHLVIADRSWIESAGIEIEKSGSAGCLNRIDPENIASPLKSFLKNQLSIWLESGDIFDEEIQYYSFTGGKFLAMPPNAGSGAETIQADNPFVILVDNPVECLKVKSFILPAASSGNVLFKDKSFVVAELDRYQISPFIISVDSVSDTAIETAQQFGSDALYRILACVVIMISTLVTCVIRAFIWSAENRKRIFVLHSAGEQYKTIICRQILKEFPFFFGAVIVGSIASMQFGSYLKIFLLVSLTVIVLVSVAGYFSSFYLFMKKGFENACRRYY